MIWFWCRMSAGLTRRACDGFGDAAGGCVAAARAAAFGHPAEIAKVSGRSVALIKKCGTWKALDPVYIHPV
jgi:hypothetical protein